MLLVCSSRPPYPCYPQQPFPWFSWCYHTTLKWCRDYSFSVLHMMRSTYDALYSQISEKILISVEMIVYRDPLVLGNYDDNDSRGFLGEDFFTRLGEMLMTYDWTSLMFLFLSAWIWIPYFLKGQYLLTMTELWCTFCAINILQGNVYLARKHVLALSCKTKVHYMRDGSLARMEYIVYHLPLALFEGGCHLYMSCVNSPLQAILLYCAEVETFF